MGKENISQKETILTRMGNHEELTHLASFLISDAANFINGEIVTIDGGRNLNNQSDGFSQLASLSDQEWDLIRDSIKSNNKKDKSKRQ